VVLILNRRWMLEGIGTVAAICTTVAFLPQVIHVWRSKSASDVSLTMFLFFGFGVICWLVYGIGLGSVPMMVANAVTLAQVLVILALKRRYDGNSKQ
jgi:MtN3 and saliva related transmembrane protein